ncbi:hypothetical protein WA158_004572 [Blastocystis sp. Blastoise]
MSTTEFQLTEEKYLFTFQDETQLWIPKEFIEKYPQFPFYNIIEHSEKYDDGSYYIDMLPFHIEQVISFLMEENMDIDSLDLKESYDIYKTLFEYSVTIDKEIQSDLLFHIEELFYKYLKNNNCHVDRYRYNYVKSYMPMDLFNLEEKKIYYDLFTSKRKNELLYYSLLIKMMNITKVIIIYDYSSNIPLEYICPSCIKDIFPSLEKLAITVITHYKKTDVLLNPNSDEYIMEYIRLFKKYNYKIGHPEIYEYYTKSEMNEYNKISSLDLNKLYYSHDLIDSYNERREKNELPKLYRYVVNEALYTNDYSSVETNEIEDEYTLDDEVIIIYDEKTNDKTFTIDTVSSKLGISQLLFLPSYLYLYNQIDPMFFMKLFEEGVFDSLTTFSIKWIKRLANIIDENLFNKIMTTHVFPNVSELIYGDFDDYYDDNNATDNFDSLFPASLISMIDTIRINEIVFDQEEEIVLRLDEIAYTHSIHIDINVDSSRSENINLFESIENNNQNIDSLDIMFNDDDDYYYDDYYYDNSDDDNDDDNDDKDKDKDDNDDNDNDNDNNNNNQHKIDVRNALERFLNTNILKHLNYLYVSFDDDISVEYLTWISTLFNDNTFNTIHKLRINLYSIKEDSSSECLTACENILEKLTSKASIVTIRDCTVTLLNRLIPKGCFHKTTQLFLEVYDMPNDNFCKLYTTNNFPQLKSINICDLYDRKWWSSFIDIFYRYMNNNNFQLSSIVRLREYYYDSDYDEYCVYDPNYSILRCKYDSNSFINTIIGTYDETMSTFEIETLFDCINENKTQNIRSLNLYIYDEEQLSKLINFITTGKIPKLKEFIFYIGCDISTEQIDIYEQQLQDSTFIQENHVDYKLIKDN